MTSDYLMASSFDPLDENLTVVRRSYNNGWTRGKETVRLASPKAVIAMTPVFWQLQPLIEHACAGVAPVFAADPTNLALVEAALRADMDAVVIAAADSFGLSSHGASRGILPRAWIVIHQLKAENWNLPLPLLEDRSVFLAQEVQSAPGVTVLEQCERLIEAKSPHFHRTENAEAEFPTVGTCACGRAIVSKSL